MAMLAFGRDGRVWNTEGVPKVCLAGKPLLLLPLLSLLSLSMSMSLSLLSLQLDGKISS